MIYCSVVTFRRLSSTFVFLVVLVQNFMKIMGHIFTYVVAPVLFFIFMVLFLCVSLLVQLSLQE